jgi:putative Mg2+ transporter-C (MgtC) family protein
MNPAQTLIPFHLIFERLLFAAALGALIGIERDLRRRPAGIRTSMFVCMATALFTIVSHQLGVLWGDAGTTRIASNIVQGVGFLGAGAILKEGAGLVGMTTAATIFVEAAIGMAAGGGFYGVAGATTGIALFALVVLAWFVDKLSLKYRSVLFRITGGRAEHLAGEVQKLLSDLQLPVRHFRVSMEGSNSVVEFETEVNHGQEERIVKQLHREGVVTELLPGSGHRE